MGATLALSKGFETKWTALSGGMQGAVRLMSSSQFTIGRSPECEFVIVNDPKCSRKHARVDWVGDSCVVTSLNPQNLLLINGTEKESANLHDGDRIMIGETEMLFNMSTAAAETGVGHQKRRGDLQSAAQSPQMMNFAPPQSYRTPPPTASRSRPKKKEIPLARKLIFAAVGLAVLLVLLPSGKKKKDEQLIITTQQIQADIDAANKLQESAVSVQAKKFEGSITARQAQENFVRGFRDYRKGQYERSLDSFQACLSLDPTHPLCTRYLRLAQRRFNELVQYNVVLGRKYRDQNQFAACRAAFRNVMVMIKDSNSMTYREAKASYDACNALIEGRF